MKTYYLFFVLQIFLYCTSAAYSQAGIAVTQRLPEGMLDVYSETWGLVLPRTPDINNVVNPQGGLLVPGTLVFDLAEDCLKYVMNDNTFSACLIVE